MITLDVSGTIVHFDAKNLRTITCESESDVTTLVDRINSQATGQHPPTDHEADSGRGQAIQEAAEQETYAGDSVKGYGKGADIKIYKKSGGHYARITSTKDHEVIWFLKDYKSLSKMQRKILQFTFNLPTNTCLKSTGTKSKETGDRKKVGDMNMRKQHIEQLPYIYKQFHKYSDKLRSQIYHNDSKFIDYLIDNNGKRSGTISLHQYLRFTMAGITLQELKDFKGKKRYHTIRNWRAGDPECDIVFECSLLSKDVKKLRKHYKRK